MIRPSREPLGRFFRTAARALQKVRKFVWRFTGRPAGVHAVPLTAAGEVVLVKLTYARGWRLPGGGRHKAEAPEEAIVRELEEEIGMTRHGSLERVHEAGVDPALGVLFIAHRVEYRPRRSIEIDQVRAFKPDALPDETTDRTRRWIAHVHRKKAAQGSSALPRAGEQDDSVPV